MPSNLDHIIDTLDLAGKLLLKSSTRITVAKNTTLFKPGDLCNSFLIVISGSIKVHQLSANGREIILYRVQDGETCLLTTASLLSRDTYSASAVSETEVTALTFSAEIFDKAISESKSLRNFIFNNYSHRLGNLLSLVGELAFESLDSRLCQCLIQQSNNTSMVCKTHQQLAEELGSTREVISRQLKEFERLGWINLSRGQVELLQTDKLQNFFERNRIA